MDVALASCRQLPEPDFDEAPLLQALTGRGVECEVLAWDDPASDWSKTRVVLLRSTWNYARHPEAFLDWARAASRCSELQNPLALVEWNLHKRYLIDLERAGVATTPTELIRQGSSDSLEEVLARRGWETVVVKPAISAASFRTRKFDRGDLAEGEAHLRALATSADVLVQQYLPSVEDHGERALVWIDGELTHAVRKSPRFDGDDESVSSQHVEISEAEARLASAALAATRETLSQEPLYARIDVAPGADGEPCLMELELIEPSLFFPQSAAALDRMVGAIERRLAG